ncbi:MAG: hypothetical protein RR840_10200 [Clostridium sp.]
MAINLFTLDYSDPNIVKIMQQKAIQTVKKGSGSERSNNNKKDNKRNQDKNKQKSYGKELKIIFEKLDLNFEYIIEKERILVRVLDKDNNLILEDIIDNLYDLLLSIKSDTGKIIDLKI